MDLYILRNNYIENAPRIYCDLVNDTVKITVTQSDDSSYTKSIDLKQLQQREDITDMAFYPVCIEDAPFINAYNFENLKIKPLSETLDVSKIVAGIIVPSAMDIKSYCVSVNELSTNVVAYNDVEFDDIIAHTPAEAFPKLNVISMGVEESILRFRIVSNKAYNQNVYCLAEAGELQTPVVNLTEGIGTGSIDLNGLERGTRFKLFFSFYKTPIIAEFNIKV